jgi:predicted O-methyltransferase YrrM
MTLTYTCENQLIERALQRLKDDKLVSPDAFFNYDAPHKLRREVAYRDYDFLSRLCRIAEAEIVRSVLAWLQQKGLAPASAAFDKGGFDELRQQVKEKFVTPGSSVTPVMERLLYMLSSLKKPRRVVGIGTYYGNAFVWSSGSSCGPGQIYQAQRVYGVDIDPGATEGARENFKKLAHTDHVQFIAEDGLKTAERLPGPFDYVFLDVGGPGLGKSLYLELLRKLYDKIEPGGWVLAHDTVVPPFAEQLAEYLAFVRDKKNFRESISFDVDPFGLELSIK